MNEAVTPYVQFFFVDTSRAPKVYWKYLLVNLDTRHVLRHIDDREGPPIPSNWKIAECLPDFKWQCEFNDPENNFK